MSLFTIQSAIPITRWLLSTFLVLLSIIGIRQFKQWHRLRHIPGPRFAGWSSWWQLQGALSGRYHEKLKVASDAYGSLVRIGPNQLLSVDPETLRHISSVRNAYTKASFYESGRIVPGVDNIVSMRDETKHKAMRAQMAPAFAIRGNDGHSIESAINRQLSNFIKLLDTKYVTDTTHPISFDMAEKTQFFALDVIGDISVGKPFGYLEHDKDLYDYNQINMTSLPIMNIVSVYPWLTQIVHKWPLRLVLPKEEDQVGFGRLMGFIRGFVEERLQEQPSKTKDMIQMSIENGMNKTDLIQQGFISTIAGSNSTAHSLRMTILSLITTPNARQTLLEEIDNAKSTISSPISWIEIQSLSYLRAVVCEGLRMWPPVAGLGFKNVPRGGDTINGYFVPEGTEIGQGYFAVGRSKVIWGEDADVFRPERWLNISESDEKEMHAAIDTHFGGGKYSCLGKSIALMELHKSVFELIRRYDMSLVNPEHPIKVQTSVFLFASDFWITASPRRA